MEPDAARLVVVPGAVAVITVPSNTYREKDASGSARPSRRSTWDGLRGRRSRTWTGPRYEVTAAATPSESGTAVGAIVIRLRGNEVLIADILRKGNWASLLELLK